MQFNPDKGWRRKIETIDRLIERAKEARYLRQSVFAVMSAEESQKLTTATLRETPEARRK